MRILQVVHGFPPHEWAGTELVTLQLSQALRVRGHQVTVLTRTADPAAEEFSVRAERMDGLEVVRIVNNYTHTTSFRLFYDNSFFNLPFTRLLERVRPEVVHFQHLAHLSVSLLPLTAGLGYPTVLTLHDFFFPCHLLHLIDSQGRLCPGPERGERCVPCLRESASPEEARRRFSYMERVLRAADRILTPSVFLAQKIEGYFPFLAHRLQAVPLGVTRVPRVLRARAPGAPLRILYIGVLLPHKGAHVLVEALKGLPADTIAVSVYGAVVPFWRSYAERLREEARGLSVQFHDTYPHDQLGAILSRHDVLVMPMIWEETFSILTREALLAGLPVIAARRGALPEVVRDGENGLLFEPEDSADLRRCLQRVSAEPGLLERLSPRTAAVKSVEEYAGEIESLYNDLVPGTRSQGKDKPEQMMTPHVASERSIVSGEVAPVRLSVCIPTYNGEEFIAAAIKSVLAQSFQDFELLVVDDRSTDATLDIVRSFTDPRIRIDQNEKRLGIPGNWNRCLSLARGEYCCLFHQDDVMLPENLQRKIQVLAADPTVGFVHSAVELLVEASAPTAVADWMEPATEDFIVEGLRYFRKLLFAGNLICAPTVVTRRQRLLDLGGFDEALGFACDYEMWMKVCVDGRVAFLSQPLIRYRWHGKNASHAYRFERGVEEGLLAGRRALQYYLERAGRQEEGEVLQEAVTSLAKLRLWAAELEKGRVWLGGQGRNWQRTSEEREKMVQEQRAWIAELEKGKAWLEEQARNWQRASEEQEHMIQEQKAWIAELEKGKAWLEEQWHYWQAEAARYRESTWVRVGSRLGMVDPSNPFSREKEREKS